MTINPPCARWLTITLLLTFFCPAAPAEETRSPRESEQSPSPFVVDARVDVPVIALASALWALPRLMADELPSDSCYPCDKDEVNAFDRTTIELYSDGASLASDIVLGALPLAAIGLSFAGTSKKIGYRSVLEDFTIFAEAMAVTGMLHQIVRHAFDRPRPYMYQDDAGDSKRRHDDEDTSSFYSGHTALAFTAATSMSLLFAVRHSEKLVWKSIVWSFSLAAAATVGALRVVAGKHFMSDVVTGAVVGASVGLLVPALHRRGKSAGISVSVGPRDIELLVVF